MLVAYGVRRDGTRHLLVFMRSQGESQANWEGLLGDLYRRGLPARADRYRRLLRLAAPPTCNLQVPCTPVTLVLMLRFARIMGWS